MFTKALVPLDNTEISEGIIPIVTQLARGLQMEVVLATAINLNHPREGCSAEYAVVLEDLHRRPQSGSWASRRRRPKAT